MPIRFRCHTCHKSLAGASCLAGKRIVCPVCKTRLTVPPDEPEPQISTEPAAVSPVQVVEIPAGDAERPVHPAVWACGVVLLLAGLSVAAFMALRTLGTDLNQPGPAAAQVDAHQVANIEDLPGLEAIPDADETDLPEVIPGS